MLRLAIIAVCSLALLAGCGEDDGSSADAGAAPAAAGLTRARLAPVPELTPCTSIYGGPAEARVTGTLRGERVDARFSREDGCQIARWDRNQDLLGPPAPGP